MWVFFTHVRVHAYIHMMVWLIIPCGAGGGDVKIGSHKVSFREKTQSKVGPMDNMSNSPGGGDVKVRLSHMKNALGLGVHCNFA